MTKRPLLPPDPPDGVLHTLTSLLSPLLLSLFFLEALRQYFSQVYLVVWAALFSEPVDLDGLAIAMLMLAAMLAPLLLPLLRRRFGSSEIALWAAVGASLSRLLLSAGLPFGVEVAASCATVGLFGLFLPAYLEAHHASHHPRRSGGYLVAGLALALAYDMAIRALGTTVDLSLQPSWLPAQVVLSALAIATAYLSRPRVSSKPDSSGLPRSSPRFAVLVLSGIGPLLFLEYNLFLHASTVSRWIQVDYDLMSILLPAATVIGLLVPRLPHSQRLPAAVAQNVLILIAVLAFLWWDGWLAASLILVGQMCMVLDLRLLFRFAGAHIYKRNPSTVVGVGLAVGLLAAFVLTFVLTLSFAYAYTVDAFRGTEPLSFLLATLGLGVAVIIGASRKWTPRVPSPVVAWVRSSLAALPVLMALVAAALQPAVSPQPSERPFLNLMIYNLHQSFGMDNKLDLEEIAATIRLGDPDIIGLQEADAGRVPSLSTDQVLWLSRRLNMYSFYGPSWGDTYGVAVLSKYPIIGEQRYLLVSALQQRSCLETTVDLGQQTVTFFSVHLGLETEERHRQLDELLGITNRAPVPKVLVGDFNAKPDSAEITRVLQQFQDSFAVAGTGSGYTSPANAPIETIDYVFVSPDIQALSAEVIPSLASDHLPVVARVQMAPP